MSEKKYEPNPSLFRELDHPFEDLAAADAAVRAFLEELGEVRKKHRIPNVLTVIQASAKAADGEESTFFVPHFYGNWLLMESLAAYAYGDAVKERQEYIGKLVTGSNLSRHKKQP